MYAPRSADQLTALAKRLSDKGLLAVGNIYSVADLARINAVMDPIFASRANERRAYVRPDEMHDAGILEFVLSRKMKDLILSIVPNPVLYHFHAYEIAGHSAESHIFADQLGGWHRDPDSEFYPRDPTHVSIFVYLSEVGEEDGPFQFSPHSPDQPLHSSSPVVSMTGPIGMSFVWRRSHYHRAAPNRGPRRRRLVKISVQPNEFPSAHLRNEFFRKVVEELPAGDDELDLLLGRYQGRSGPKLDSNQAIKFFDVEPNSQINVPANILKQMKRREEAERGKPVAYD
jgi:hypothetical protein